MPKELIIQKSHFYSYQDEKHFFDWLESIDGVDCVLSVPKGLSIRFRGNGLNRRDLYDLIAVLMRYDVDMRGLQALVTPKNDTWMKNPHAYWYPKVFGSKAQKTERTAQLKGKSRTKRDK